VQFAIKDWWISDYMAYYGKGEAILSVDCLTDCIVLQTDISSIEKVFKRFPQIETFHRKNLEKSFVRINKRIVNQLQLNARDRYLNFIDDFPKMESVAKNFHIASYLGITKQSLSRIRSQK
jgi:GTP1/Obg family GTP-binding protein